MQNQKTDPKRLAAIAKVIAMEVRKSMEDFHAKHLGDDPMKDSNPIVRDAIFSQTSKQTTIFG